MENIKSIKENIKSLNDGIHELDKGIGKMEMLNQLQIDLLKQAQQLINQIVGDKQ
jgi:exonuclease VII small subunit